MSAIASEIERFNRLSASWWNPIGPMRPLHVVNALRLQLVLARLEDHFKLAPGGSLDSQARAIARRLTEQSGVQVVVADTTALVIAAYSERVFNDRSLLGASLRAQAPCRLTLLMGLDMPWQADGLFREGPGMRADIDALLRRELQSAGIPFQTVYGSAEARAQHALRAVGALLGRPLASHDTVIEAGNGRWTCENCSDPDCERKLFSGLVNSRSS